MRRALSLLTWTCVARPALRLDGQMTDEHRQTLESSLIGSYAIERELGGGGMSRVFLATESALARRVVIKVLSPDLAAAVNTERFRREVQIIAQLQHAYIVPVLTSGSAGGLPYYTMPYVEGQTLRTRIEQEGGLPVPDVQRILRNMLEALSYAHERGIVHRDIKPENILLTRQHALLLDFGIAKALSDATGSAGPRLTTVGVAVGTPAYMAPEQAVGDTATDHRADIYSAGAVAYEILSGRPLFAGRSSQAMLAAHAVEVPEPVGKRRPDAPPALAAVIMHALQKEPADRPQSADEMLRELESASRSQSPRVWPIRWRTPAASRHDRKFWWKAIAVAVSAAAVGAYLLVGPITFASRKVEVMPSIAVLPFVNTSGSRDDEYLSDGLSEQLIAALSNVPALQVAARTSSFAFKGKNEDVRAIGKRLRVKHILGGSVLRSGDRLRVSAQLTNVETGYNLWSDTYDRQMTDVLALQEQISRSIVDALQVRLAGANANRPIVKHTTTDPEAYQLYLRGRYFLNQRGAALLKAHEYFDRAIERDSGFAAAWAGLSETHHVSGAWAFTPPRAANQLAQHAAIRALELDSTMVDARIGLANVLCSRNDFDVAYAHFRWALQLDERSGRAHYFYSFCLGRAGDLQGALAAGRRAVELDPLNPQFAAAPARAYVYGGRPGTALAVLRPAVDMAPGLRTLRTWMVFATVELRDRAALRQLAEVQQSIPDPSSRFFGDFTTALADVISGDTAGAARRMAPYTAEPPAGREILVAYVHSLRADESAAMRLLELTYEREADVNGWVNLPGFAWLRAKPAFKGLAQRYRIPLTLEPLGP